VLVVCTGNIARSPYLERRLQNDLDHISPQAFSVSSAGTRATSARGMASGTRAALTRRGISERGFRSRQLTEADAKAADLIITMSEPHRRDILDIAPSVLTKLFTVSELEALAAAEVPTVSHRPQDRIQLAARQRSTTARSPQREVHDPYGQGDSAYAAMAERLDHASSGISNWLAAK